MDYEKSSLVIAAAIVVAILLALYFFSAPLRVEHKGGYKVDEPKAESHSEPAEPPQLS